MATKTVGVRELKENAPRLVQRAARGERIVITRHGKSVAVLSPVTPDDRVAAHPSLSSWLLERAAFERLLPQLERKYDGRYVAVASGKVVDSDPDHDALYHRVSSRLHGHSFFVGRVGAAPPVVDMPGFEIS
jgi:prevent-host-death family protein